MAATGVNRLNSAWTFCYNKGCVFLANLLIAPSDDWLPYWGVAGVEKRVPDSKGAERRGYIIGYHAIFNPGLGFCVWRADGQGSLDKGTGQAD